MHFSEMHFINIIQWLLFMFTNEVNSSNLLIEKLRNISENLPNISDVSSTHTISNPGKCLKFQCKFICHNGTHATIEQNINEVYDKECPLIKELHLINYHFPRKILPKKLLGPISNNVSHLSIFSSDIEHIDTGAFESQTLTGVHLENLKLKYIEKGIFKNVNEQFTSFTLIQSNPELTSVEAGFLEHIKYQIKNLTIQTGLIDVQNLTNSQHLLNNLEYIDLSYNNFEDHLEQKSFSQLSVVQSLNLSHSEITYLTMFIFANLLTLRTLDLSHNKLIYIYPIIFGSSGRPSKGMNLYLNQNPWECTCELQNDMSILLANDQDVQVYCDNFDNILVTSEVLCMSTSEPPQPPKPPQLMTPSSNLPSTKFPYTSQITTLSTKISTLSTPTSTVFLTTDSDPEGAIGFMTSPTEPVETTELLPPPTASEFNAYATTNELECHKDNGKMETENLSIYWPNTLFDIVKKKGLEVDVVVRTNYNQTYGVLWFSKVTRLYYKMETNHNEYGLGCYGKVEHVTTVNHLLPDMSYTFCLILKDYLTVSPFSCKSVYIESNLDADYNAWLTTNMKATGISVMIIGIILFLFLGILSVFIVLKRKPSLLKGSKRIAMQKSDASNIIVFPEDKTLEKFKLMEEQLANNKLGPFPFRRRVSSNSFDSIQSYMNPENFNVYEVIPAHQSNLKVRYAEVPFKRKRSSNDPLPKIPNAVDGNTSPYFARKPVDLCYEIEASVYM